MNLSPTASSVSTSTVSKSTSSASNSTLHPNPTASPYHRRRSVDTGGLNLVVNDISGSGSGRGYGGWVDQDGDNPSSTEVAELVLAWRDETTTMIDQAHPLRHPISPPDSASKNRKAKYIEELSEWGFNGADLEFEDVLLCSNLLFELLWSIDGMEQDVGLPHVSAIIPPFLSRVSKLYSEQCRYHNFQHALDVLQAMYYYLYRAGCVPKLDILNNQTPEMVASDSHSDEKIHAPPPQRTIWRRKRTGDDTLLQRTLRNQDIFALFVAAIGHDIAHPGVNNAFLNKTKTPVAELFADRSVLEMMHCTLLLQVMREHGMGHLLDGRRSRVALFSTSSQSRNRIDSDPGTVSRDTNGIVPGYIDFEDPTVNGTSTATPRPALKKSVSASQAQYDKKGRYGLGTEFRRLLSDTILATDMGVHSKWMETLKRYTEEKCGPTTPNPIDDSEDDVHRTRVLLCQALIKCADISNASRPPPACEHWSTCLMQEWYAQNKLEQQLSMAPSFGHVNDPKAMIKSQINFTTFFTLPLYQATEPIVPEMTEFVGQCDKNVDRWKARQAEMNATNVDVEGDTDESKMPRFPYYVHGKLPDIKTMFTLAVPPSLQMPAPEVSWPLVQADSSSVSDSEKSVPSSNGNGIIQSEPPSPRTDLDIDLPFYKPHHHTELPQVSIPTSQSTAASVSSAASSVNQLKSGTTVSTASTASPLFSPRSTTTTSSTTSRSEAPSPSPSASTTSNRDALRAVYDAHKPKGLRHGNARISWQGFFTGPIGVTIPPFLPVAAGGPVSSPPDVIFKTQEPDTSGS
ncbi:hypothetical protein M422DRAFT_261310 [Sphaerobolus stellatus SS14]|uniref:Phosphodiesterase n=1 Tax=Sphaerobolus stellatus (strain SS14) TaxID=990650 RepID=A0A0C9VFH7_SPHS4|nr:hypothetical protein M422DRAFT_261310 [Sphaerobolus stellatus SS14]